MPKRTFAALRFTEDENLRDRVYWYLAEFPVCAGEEVIAPVGPHGRLQKGRVERVRLSEEEDAPYDVRLIKRVVAKYGERRLSFGETTAYEFGGIRYDSRHFTAYHVLVYAETEPEDADMVWGYGLSAIKRDPALGDGELYAELARGRGLLLAGGEGKEICGLLRGFVGGDPGAVARLVSLGLRGETAEALFTALTCLKR